MNVLRLQVRLDAVTVRIAEAEHNAVVRRVATTDSTRIAGREARAGDLWQAVLDAVAEAGAGAGAGAADPLEAIELDDTGASLAMWDLETLGAPTPLLGAEAGFGAAVGAIAAHDPQAWALVADDRHGLGTLGSYVLARMTRGTWHAVSPAAALQTGLSTPGLSAAPPEGRVRWDAAACAQADVPIEALPVILGDWSGVVTDPRTLPGLRVPVRPAG